MNRKKLEQHLRKHGCESDHHGAKHDDCRNPETGATTTLPRHQTVKKTTGRAICRDLGVPFPSGS